MGEGSLKTELEKDTRTIELVPRSVREERSSDEDASFGIMQAKEPHFSSPYDNSGVGKRRAD